MNIKYFSEAKPILEEIADRLTLNLSKSSDWKIAKKLCEQFIIRKRKEYAREYRGEQAFEE